MIDFEIELFKRSKPKGAEALLYLWLFDPRAGLFGLSRRPFDVPSHLRRVGVVLDYVTKKDESDPFRFVRMTKAMRMRSKAVAIAFRDWPLDERLDALYRELYEALGAPASPLPKKEESNDQRTALAGGPPPRRPVPAPYPGGKESLSGGVWDAGATATHQAPPPRRK